MTTLAWKKRNFEVLADTDEVFENDPGRGTPAIVYDGKGNQGAFWCALETGEINGVRIPSKIRTWLEKIQPAIEEFLYPN